MIETTVRLRRGPDSLRARINAITSPRRGVLETSRKALRQRDDATTKPYWVHWDQARFALRPQQRRHWRNLHQWLAQFDGEVRPSATGSELRIRASLGTYATATYLIVLSLMLFMVIGLMLSDPLVACTALGLAAALVYGVRVQLQRGLAKLIAALDRDE